MELLKDKVIVKVSSEEARKIREAGCDIVRLFPIYEEKIRDGVEVRKVRLVADGRTHKPVGPTYAATPSREEFLILIHLIAKEGWDWVHVDESRAFTGAAHTDPKEVLIRMKGDTDYWRVINALYGLKTAPLMYQRKAVDRLERLGFKRKEMCSNTYIKHVLQDDGTDVIVIVYGYVDDYFFTSSNSDTLRTCLEEFRAEIIRTGTNTTEPIWNPTEGLGLEFERDKTKNIISASMKKKIMEMGGKFLNDKSKSKQHLPMSTSQYLIRDEQFNDLPDGQRYRAEFLDAVGINRYLAIVGSLLWVMGVRFDIAFAVTYLTWFTHLPRVHHMEVAQRVVEYLVTTIDEPLVLGGTADMKIVTQTDAALGIAPKMRSVIAEFTTLGDGSGAISAKVTATEHIPLSSYEAELDGTAQALDDNTRIYGKVVGEEFEDWELEGVTQSFKTSARVKNVLTELERPGITRIIWGDNEKAIQFVKREVEGKNLRHANLRLWYIRSEVQKMQVEYLWISGKKLDVNAMTKPVQRSEIARLRWKVQGYKLLGRPEPIVNNSTNVEE
jgi:hypothetical protein